MKHSVKAWLAIIAIAIFAIWASSFITPVKSVTASTPTSEQWEVKEVARDGFSVHVITDPYTQIQYIIVYRYNRDEGVALAITPRITQKKP